jgi:predicted enzyme related to lactoylglutathione lyase
MSSTSPLVHLELHTRDLPGAQELYAQLLGWRSERIPYSRGTYTALELGSEEVGGGIVECPVQAPIWLPYVEVPEVRVATERARTLGAGVLMEPREGPAGWRSVVAAPAGGQIAFWEPKVRY